MIDKSPFSKYFFLVILISGLKWICLSQPLMAMENEPERIFVHFDRTFYLIGETIHYKIYFLRERPAGSGIVHVDLVDSAGNIYMNQVHQVNGNTASGSFRIPYHFREANYLFRCYTRWNIGFEQNHTYYRLIPLFNEFLVEEEIKPATETTGLTGSRPSPEKKSPGSIRIHLLNPQPVHCGDLVTLQFISSWEDLPVTANLSVVVKKGGQDAANSNLLSPIEPDQEADGSRIEDGEFLHEDSLAIRGIARDPVNGEPVSSRVLSVYNVRNAGFSRLVSRKGRFEFKLPLLEGTADLQIINMNPFQPRVPDITWIPLNKALPPDPAFQDKPERTETAREYTLSARMRN